ncbi:MAG: hypothetical protein KJO84_00020, partial [Acidimicrobiia bacterium]|nr:hypothetical protein [Acidimicrobiia bacterium]
MSRRLGLAITAIALATAGCSDALPTAESTTSTTSTATTVATTTTTTTTVVGPTASPRGLAAWLAEVEAAGPSTAQVMVDEFWGANVFPLVFADQVAFVYKGDASSVVWNGDFNRWGAWDGVTGERVADTDLWVGRIETLPVDARTLYKVVVDGEWLLDPGNPDTQLGGFGPNSELTMPLFTETSFAERDPTVPKGEVTSGVYFSNNLGYDVAYQVYTPAVVEGADVPLLVVTDGSDWVDLGSLPVILDNLIDAGRIEPVIAVFSDAWDPDRSVNRRESEFLERPREFGRFLADELIPFIDSSYPTAATRESRAVIGASYGGLAVTYLALLEDDTFSKYGFFSPSWWLFGDPASAPTPEARAVAEELGALASDNTGDLEPGS